MSIVPRYSTTSPSIAQTCTLPGTPPTNSSDLLLDFLDCIEFEKFDEASVILSKGTLDIQTHPDFYEFDINKLLLPSTKALRFYLEPSVDPVSSLQKALRITEFFADKGIESSYCRLCRAAVYLHLKEDTKLATLMQELCQPRRAYEESDLLLLNQRMLRHDDREIKEFFLAPLQKALLEFAAFTCPEFPMILENKA